MDKMTDQTPKDLTLTRVFNAPRSLVFKAWTDPKLVAQWWSPRMYSNPVCELDVRPGGAILVHMRGPDGIDNPMTGVYHEIVEPERLVFTTYAVPDETGQYNLQVLNTVTFEEKGDQTHLTMHAVVVKSTPATSGALSGMREGWSQSLDKLNETVTNQGLKTMITLNPDMHMLYITRTFNAPRELVFQVCADPNLIPQWWGPRRLTTRIEQMDVRPGGTWRYVQQDAEGNQFVFHGAYQQIVPPERVISTFEFEGMPGHPVTEISIFEEFDGKTRLTVTDIYQTVEDMYGMVESGMESGVVESNDRLAELLVELQREPRVK
jgi:uncharacterized protein YndB with AHSA1/START domain